ncbi:MAG: type II secretion system major pseudopilin GspG [Phycisphaerales bacterium]|nr:type II secretion system major pseudopilin GspG [Phycisphaerales bacterium]
MSRVRQSLNFASRQRRGFTLIELLLVLIILAVLASVAVPIYTGRSKKAKIDATKASISNIETAIDTFESEQGRFPESLDELVHPPEAQDGSQPTRYLKALPTDGWGHPFFYKVPGNVNTDRYDIWSAGPNGIDENGSGDDITSWVKEN